MTTQMPPLSQEQQNLVQFKPEGNLLIRGQAGSGKTTVLAARASWINSRLFKSSMLFVTYNKGLATYVKHLLQDAGAEDEVSVYTFHEWARKFASDHGHHIKGWITERDKRILIEEILDAQKTSGSTTSLLDQPVRFWVDEIGWIYGQGIQSKNAYRSAERVGRGREVQVRGSDRDLAWDVFQDFDREVCRRQLCDSNNPGGLVLRAMKDSGYKMRTDTKKAHVFVDEVQDFDSTWLAALAPVATESMTLAGDLAQKIYRRSFTWKSVGMEIPPSRSRSLKGSFRTTRQIMEVAAPLCSHDELQTDGDYVLPSLPTKEGPRVRRIRRPNWWEARDAALDCVKDLSDGLEGKSIAVACHFNKTLDVVVQELVDRGVPATKSKGSDLVRRGAVHVTTYYQLKGLEFDHVVLLDLDKNTTPDFFLENLTTDEDALSVETRLRRLVYVAMTRAKSSVLIAGGMPFCPFFDGIDSSLFEEL